MMLDDLKLIHERDPQDTLGIAARQSTQLEYVFDVAEHQLDVTNVVYVAMGGSALAALISTVWPSYNLPFEVVRDYDIPAHVSDKTFFIAASYSGNTEETLAALAAAEQRHAKIAVIAGGGKLADIARSKGYPLALLPKAEQPRYAVYYNLKALVTLLEKAGLVANEGAEFGIHQTAAFLREKMLAWQPEVPTVRNPAKQIAQELMGKSIVVYGGPKMFPAVYKWKISFNENAKHIAWWNQLPEFNHNEFIGWSKQPVDKPYAVIDLRSKFEHPRVQKRFAVGARMLSGMRPAPIVVEAEGETLLEHLLWTIAFGDFVSLYLALLNNINPAPVDLVEKFKKAMNE